jgi:hypothetical protein
LYVFILISLKNSRMKRKGSGELYELLAAVIALVLVIAFYVGSSSSLNQMMPLMIIVVGGVLIVGGLHVRNTTLAAAGVALLALAIVFSETVL